VNAKSAVTVPVTPEKANALVVVGPENWTSFGGAIEMSNGTEPVPAKTAAVPESKNSVRGPSLAVAMKVYGD